MSFIREVADKVQLHVQHRQNSLTAMFIIRFYGAFVLISTLSEFYYFITKAKLSLTYC